MKTFDWKDRYYNGYNIDVTATSKYVSLLGTNNGDGSRKNPLALSRLNLTTTYILSSGYFEIVTVTNTQGLQEIIGQGPTNTQITHVIAGDGYGRDYTLTNLCVTPITNNNRTNRYFSCIIKDGNQLTNNHYCYNSILINSWSIISNTISKCTLVDALCYFQNMSLYNNCTVTINQTNINNYRNNYLAFNNCKFQIGNETTPTALIGNNVDELRQNLADRCTAESITLPAFSEYGEANILMGRWVFSNTSITGEYNTIKNSEIDQFAKKRGFYFGHTDKTVKVIPIVSTDNVPQSFASNNPKSKTIVSNDSITLDKTTSIIDRNLGYADSKIIWLGGKYELTALNVIHNLPPNVGLSLDSLFSFGDPVTNIEPDTNYIVRSSDKLPAIIKYNGVEYDTSLLNRNNVFRGVNNVTAFEVVSGNPQILPVLDFANHNSVQMRIVTDLPTEKITTGNLQAGYWYFVAPNNLADTSGSVTYKGVKRSCFDSFLATDTTAVTALDKCHLRRCWRQDYNEANEVTDKAFWNGKQKPKLFDVLPSDLRCFHKNNSPSEPEMQNDASGDYIASGHIDFYNGVNGSAGFKIPAFPLIGSFMQIRIPISTLNPM